jgi:hypothetical protein
VLQQQLLLQRINMLRTKDLPGTQPVVELASKWQSDLHALAQFAATVVLNFQQVL